AMSVRVSVIGGNAGGVPEIIADGESGLLFETRNAESLAAALRRLHDDPGLRARLAGVGRRVGGERLYLGPGPALRRAGGDPARQRPAGGRAGCAPPHAIGAAGHAAGPQPVASYSPA